MRKLLATVAAVMLLGPTANAQQNPNDLVEDAAKEVLEQISSRRDELSNNREALYALVDELLLPKFDTVYAAKLTLGKHWRSASREQRKRFVDAFYHSLLQTYSNGLLEISSDSMTVLPFRGDLESQKGTVRTQVILDDGTEVPVNFSVRKRDDGWRVWDVSIEGISYVKNYRSDFNAEIQANGLEALITRLESAASASAGST